jgi:hypothetical protein
MLIESTQEPVPDDVKVVEDWGYLSIMNESGIQASGRHILVDGSEESIKTWLAPHKGVWVGRGSPVEQNFSIMHIK